MGFSANAEIEMLLALKVESLPIVNHLVLNTSSELLEGEVVANDTRNVWYISEHFVFVGRVMPCQKGFNGMDGSQCRGNGTHSYSYIHSMILA